MAQNAKQLAEMILQNVGGKDHVRERSNCMTRLRLSLKDSSFDKKEEIEKIPDVMRVVVLG